MVRHKYDYSGKAVAQVKEEYDKQLEIQRLESEQQLKRYRLYLWIALLVIVLMAVLWAALRYRKNKELETLKLREAQRQLQTELEQLTAQQKEMLNQQVLAIYQSGQKDRLQRIMEAFEAAYPSPRRWENEIGLSRPQQDGDASRHFVVPRLPHQGGGRPTRPERKHGGKIPLQPQKQGRF